MAVRLISSEPRMYVTASRGGIWETCGIYELDKEGEFGSLSVSLWGHDPNHRNVGATLYTLIMDPDGLVKHKVRGCEEEAIEDE